MLLDDVQAVLADLGVEVVGSSDDVMFPTISVRANLTGATVSDIKVTRSTVVLLTLVRNELKRLEAERLSQELIGSLAKVDASLDVETLRKAIEVQSRSEVCDVAWAQEVDAKMAAMPKGILFQDCAG